MPFELRNILLSVAVLLIFDHETVTMQYFERQFWGSAVFLLSKNFRPPSPLFTLPHCNLWIHQCLCRNCSICSFIAFNHNNKLPRWVHVHQKTVETLLRCLCLLLLNLCEQWVHVNYPWWPSSHAGNIPQWPIRWCAVHWSTCSQSLPQ